MALFVKKKQHRKRTPRYFDKAGRLVGWDDIETESLLLNLEDGAFGDVDIFSFAKTTDGNALLITASSLVFVVPGHGRLCPWKVVEEIGHHRVLKKSITLSEENKITFNYFTEVNFVWQVAPKTVLLERRAATSQCFTLLKMLALGNLEQLIKPNLSDVALFAMPVTKKGSLSISASGSKGWNECAVEVGQGLLKAKKKVFTLADCYVTVDSKHIDTWIIFHADTKEVTFFKCTQGLKEAEEWLAVCVANGSNSHYFAS